MRPTTQLSICNRCRPERGRGRGATGGERLHDAVASSFGGWARRENVSVVPWDCLGACDRACAVSLRAPGKFVIVLGGLDPSASVAPLIEYATTYVRSSSGYVSREDRPAALRSSVVASIPPVDP